MEPFGHLGLEGWELGPPPQSSCSKSTVVWEVKRTSCSLFCSSAQDEKEDGCVRGLLLLGEEGAVSHRWSFFTVLFHWSVWLACFETIFFYSQFALRHPKSAGGGWAMESCFPCVAGSLSCNCAIVSRVVRLCCKAVGGGSGCAARPLGVGVVVLQGSWGWEWLCCKAVGGGSGCAARPLGVGVVVLQGRWGWEWLCCKAVGGGSGAARQLGVGVVVLQGSWGWEWLCCKAVGGGSGCAARPLGVGVFWEEARIILWGGGV